MMRHAYVRTARGKECGCEMGLSVNYSVYTQYVGQKP